MRPTLQFNSRLGFFMLNGVDIGDYIELSLLTDLGVVKTLDIPGGTMPVYGFDANLTFCCEAKPPGHVEFRTGSKIVSRHLRVQTPGANAGRASRDATGSFRQSIA